MNEWVDLPVVDAIEYFTRMVYVAFKWAQRYGYFFGLCGLIWSGYKVMMSRMSVKDFWWDTCFKWIGFILLLSFYPMMTTAFRDIGNEIGMKAGGGRNEIISMIQQLKNTMEAELKNALEWQAGEMKNEISSEFDGFTLEADYADYNNMDDYLNAVESELNSKFSSKNDRKAIARKVKQFNDASDITKELYGASTLAALKSILIEENVTEYDKEGTPIGVSTYCDLNIYLKDRDGNQTYILAPGSLMRLAILCCMVMKMKNNQHFEHILEEIDNRETNGIGEWFGKGLDKLGAYMSRIAETIMYIFCCIVLIMATIFAAIQYVMTIIEYTIIVGIGAIFIPLMLFDGTKDIPKKLIPVFMNFMVKITVITICLMYVYHIILYHCTNMINDRGGMNWATVGEIVFESALMFVLTQNAPKIAQTILTGQPQLSMGEALQGVGTAVGAAVAMKQAPGAAIKAGSKAVGAAVNMKGALAKSKAASDAAKESLGEGTSLGKRMIAGGLARMAVAGKGMKDRIAARYDKERRSSGTGFSMLDKGLQTVGLMGGAGGSGGGGAGGSGSKYGQNGMDKDGKTISTESNRSYKNATTIDEKTGKERAMTAGEWVGEKESQGRDVGKSVGNFINSLSKKKVEQSENNSLEGESFTNDERANN